jgi:hypothetical protein
MDDEHFSKITKLPPSPPTHPKKKKTIIDEIAV